MNPLGKSLLGNRYQVLEKLGQGGMGEVYKGLDTQTRAFVAIKQLRGAISEDATAIERFRREGQALSDLNHPNIVKMLDMIQDDGDYFLITEFLGGGDLASLLRQQGRLSVQESLKMALELADALSRAHHLGIIHRDMKPANVLIAADGTPRLTDFGVAHVESQERLTGTGMAVGTMDYLPPEAVSGETVDARADVWSFGVMLYEMLTGQRPFEGATTIQLLTNILQGNFTDLREFCPDAPDELHELIQQMLQKDRNTRIRSARQVGAALEAILAGDESGLRGFHTPRKATGSTLERLPDAPTTPGVPTRGKFLDTPAPTIESSTSTPASKSRRGLFGVAAILIIVVLGTGLAASGVLSPAPPTATPPPTFTPAPITGDAPEGYTWQTVDEVRLLVPTNWLPIPIETFMEMAESVSPVNLDLDEFMTQVEQMQMRGLMVYAEFGSLSLMAVTIEDVGVVLPDDVLIQRAQGYASSVGLQPSGAPRILELPMGRTIQTNYALPVSDVNSVAFLAENYAVFDGITLYSFVFIGREAQFENQREKIETILASVQIGETVSPTSVPITADAPEGYTWRIFDEAQLLMPAGWVTVPLETIMQTMGGFAPAPDESAINFLLDYVQQQKAIEVYVDWTSLFVAIAAVQDTGVVLPDETLIQRAQGLMSVTGAQAIEEPGFFDLPVGRTLKLVVDIENSEANIPQGIVENYFVYHGTFLYTFAFMGRREQFDSQREKIDAILASIQFGDTAETTTIPEATPEATPVTVANMPEGWKIAQGERTVYAVPSSFIVTGGSNQNFMDAMISLIMGNTENTEALSMLEQINIDSITGNLTGNDVFFTASAYQESAILMDMETSSIVSRGVLDAANIGVAEFSIVDEVRVTLPAGEANRFEMLATVPNRPGYRFITYSFIGDDKLTIYTMAFVFLDSNSEQQLAIVDAIMQTFQILK